MTPPLDPEVGALLQLVRERAGLVFPETRHNSVLEAIERSMRNAGLADVAQYRDALARDQIAIDDLVDGITVGETYFYRDPFHFQILREVALPELERAGRQTVRAWSAGCASGEEAYSLAMMFDEAGYGERASILATDISEAALSKARRACYRPWSLRTAAGHQAQPYLHARDQLLCIGPKLKRRVEFRAHNLAADDWPSVASGITGMDVILCRNVLLYLSTDAIASIGRRLFEALNVDGWLFTGPSDPPLADTAPFEMIANAEGFYYRRRAEATALARAAARAAPRKPHAALERKGGRRDPRLIQIKRVARPAPSRPLPPASDLGTTESHLRLLANHAGSAVAADAALAALKRHPLAPELHYLHAILLTDLGREREAVAAVRRVLYLQPQTVAAHLLLTALNRQRGLLLEARRSLRVARRLLAERTRDEVVPLTDGQTVGQLADTVARELASLEGKAR